MALIFSGIIAPHGKMTLIFRVTHSGPGFVCEILQLCVITFTSSDASV